MDHNAKNGSPKILETCNLPLTGEKVVNIIITNLGVFEVNQGIRLFEYAENVSKEEIINNTGAKVFFPD